MRDSTKSMKLSVLAAQPQPQLRLLNSQKKMQ
jgi:hypothetical protein